MSDLRKRAQQVLHQCRGSLGEAIYDNDIDAMLAFAAEQVAAERARWEPMESAPKNATEILVLVQDKHGNKNILVVHYASGGGEDQPRFGPAWFFRTGYGYSELGRDNKLLSWMKLPKPEAIERGEGE